MATIQIRKVPDDVHRTYRSRAAAHGMTLQEYLLEELKANARLRTPAEVIAEIEQEMQAGGRDGFARGTAARLVRSDRVSH